MVTINRHCATQFLGFQQSATPTNANSPNGDIEVGSTWSDTSGGTATWRKCTSITPITWASAEGAGNHNFLSASHPDTVAGTGVRGDIIVRDATGWARVALGTSGQVPRSNGTDILIATLGHGDLGSVTADQHHAQAHTINGADHTTPPLTIANGGTNQTANPISQVSISASAMKGTTTAGAGDANKLPESRELATNLVNIDYIAFDQTTSENAFFQWSIPPSWNEGTITFRVKWTAAAGTGGVVFGLKGLARSDDDPLDAAWGTEVNVSDTLIATNDVHISAESAAVTIGGTPAEGDITLFNLARKTLDGGDTLNADAQLIELIIRYTRNSYTD